MLRLEFLAVLAVVSSTAHAFQWTDVKPTAAPEPLPSVISRFNPPKTTQPPDAAYDLIRRGPVRRASTDPITAYSAPDATCGYFDGRQGAPLSCGSSNTCFIAQSTAGSGVIGCCPIDGPISDCGFRTDCINAKDFANGTLCDSGCLHDTYTLKCTRSSAPYCNALTWPENGVADFFCDDAFIKTTQTLYTSYSGQTDHSWITNIYSDESLSTTPFPTTSTTTSSDGQTTTTSSSSSSSITPTPVPPANKSNTPAGPIAGGVVGGLAVISGVIVAVFFFLRHKRDKKNKELAATSAAAAAGAAAPTGSSPPGGPPAYMHADPIAKPPLDAQHQSYYAPSNQAGYVPPGAQYAPPPQHSPEMAQQQQHQQGYPPQQQQQQANFYDPNNPAGYYNPATPISHLGSATSPTTTTAGTEAGGAGGSGTGSVGTYGYTSPRPGFSEMSANMAGGPFPIDHHSSTFEVEGSVPTGRPANAGPVNEMDAAR